jgi:hypothetical protein
VHLRTDACAEARVRGRWLMVAAVLFSALCLAGPSAGQEPQPEEITQALEALEADPNLATETTIKMPRWRERDPRNPQAPPSWLAWITDFFRWLDQSARVLMWGVVLVLVAMLAAFLVRVIRRGSHATAADEFVAPTHVRDLDIRPESLPDDIGAAARSLWDAGEHRASLALLYRGLLSRLAHVHRLPIRDSTTEGDCLVLAARLLSPGMHEYSSRLVGVWQRFVYGREAVDATTVYTLCDRFGAALEMPAGNAEEAR